MLIEIRIQAEVTRTRRSGTYRLAWHRSLGGRSHSLGAFPDV
jgi:hypothetical protein